MHLKFFRTLVLVVLLAISAVAVRAADQATLPMKFVGPNPAVDVMVNGKGPYLFLIDTGASGAGRADASLAKELSLPVVGEARGGDGSGRAAVVMPIVGIEKLEAGGLVFEKLEVASRDYNLRPGLPHVAGILGLGLFEKGTLTLDYVNKQVRIDRNASLPAPDGKTIFGYEPGRAIVIDLQVGDQTVRTVIDSGNAAGRFILPAEVVDKLPKVGEPVAVGKARTVSGEIDIKKVKLAVPIRLGQFEFNDEEVIFPGPGPRANLGSKLLAEFCLTLDQANRRIRFERP